MIFKKNLKGQCEGQKSFLLPAGSVTQQMFRCFCCHFQLAAFSVPLIFPSTRAPRIRDVRAVKVTGVNVNTLCYCKLPNLAAALFLKAENDLRLSTPTTV